MKTFLFTSLLIVFEFSSVFADLEKALEAMGRGQFKLAIHEFKPLAAKGDSKAMLSIGNMYYAGNQADFLPNYFNAFSWFLKAWEKGNYDGANNLGVLFRDGLAVQQDLEIALALFQQVQKNCREEGPLKRSHRNSDKAETFMTEKQYKKAGEIKPADLKPEKLKLLLLKPRTTGKIQALVLIKKDKFMGLSFKVNFTKTPAAQSEKIKINIKRIMELESNEMPGTLGYSWKEVKNPDKNLQKNHFTWISAGFSIEIPPLTSGVLDLYKNVVNKGKVRQLSVFEKSAHPDAPWILGQDAAHAVIVCTQIPAHFKGKQEEALQVVKKMQKALVNSLPPEWVDLRRVKGDFGEAVQVIVLNRIPTRLYPQSKVRTLPFRNGLRTIGISRILMKDARLYEIGMIVPVKKDSSPEESLQNAVTILNHFHSSLKFLSK